MADYTPHIELLSKARAARIASGWGESVRAVTPPSVGRMASSAHLPGISLQILDLFLSLDQGLSEIENTLSKRPIKLGGCIAHAAAVAKERDRCLRIVESVDNHSNPMTANDCADAIRAGAKESSDA